jgi:hypothetical protein
MQVQKIAFGYTKLSRGLVSQPVEKGEKLAQIASACKNLSVSEGLEMD